MHHTIHVSLLDASDRTSTSRLVNQGLYRP